MSFVDAFWHVFHGLLPAWVVAALTAAAAKALWRHELVHERWWTLTWWSALAAMAVSVAGLAVFAQDGRMATYLVLVVVVASVVAWRGFGRRR
jgi:lipopolysaccharide export LptBFGC system permease protein LptF